MTGNGATVYIVCILAVYCRGDGEWCYSVYSVYTGCTVGVTGNGATVYIVCILAVYCRGDGEWCYSVYSVYTGCVL